MWTAMAESNYRSEIFSSTSVLIDCKANCIERKIFNIQYPSKERLDLFCNLDTISMTDGRYCE